MMTETDGASPLIATAAVLPISAVEVGSIALCRWKFVGEVFQGSTQLRRLPRSPSLVQWLFWASPWPQV